MLRFIQTVGATSCVTSCVALAALGVVACSSGGLPPVSRASLTSAELSSQYESSASLSIRKGSYENALELADRGVAFAPHSAWAHYERAVALQHLMRTNDAIAAYRLAHALFPASDMKDRSIALYGVARALDDAGRCTEAAKAYGEFAAIIERSDPAAASMARSYARECGTAHLRGGEATASDVSNDVVDGRYERALRRADIAEAVAAPDDGTRSPWVDYNRGVALSELGRTDEAVSAFEAATIGFSSKRAAGGEWGMSIAIYGRARALDEAGRCAEASKAYREYATVAPTRSQGEIALATSRKCRALVGPRLMTTR